MTLPNFLIIGAQKAGTNWLKAMLRQHPEVFISAAEIHYFNNRYLDRTTAWYAEHFAAAGAKKAVGEKTPNYLWVNRPATQANVSDVHLRIHRLLPDAKLIMLLRNPVERAISGYNLLVRRGAISPLARADELFAEAKRHSVERYGVIGMGMYFRQITTYREVFKPEQMLVLCFEEDVVAHPRAGVRKVCRFLDIDPDFEFRNLEVQIGQPWGSTPGLLVQYAFPAMRSLVRQLEQGRKSAPKIRPGSGTTATLYDLYRPENERLFKLLGWDARLWAPRRCSRAGSESL